MTESAMVEQNARAAQGAAATPLVEADRVGLGPATGPGAIHAVEIGDPEGAPVVFGHGWARTHADFIPIAELLARQGARSILLDFPGFGESPRPSETWGAAAYADAIRAHLAD
ncbi:MAG: alpha/beta fold hydrolase, partial [Pseudomonadota bacterium]